LLLLRALDAPGDLFPDEQPQLLLVCDAIWTNLSAMPGSPKVLAESWLYSTLPGLKRTALQAIRMEAACFFA